MKNVTTANLQFLILNYLIEINRAETQNKTADTLTITGNLLRIKIISEFIHDANAELIARGLDPITSATTITIICSPEQKIQYCRAAAETKNKKLNAWALEALTHKAVGGSHVH